MTLLIEQPPSDFTPTQREYLNRMFNAISTELQRGLTLRKMDRLAAVPEGTIRYFPQALTPDIPAKGVYVWDGATWVAL